MKPLSKQYLLLELYTFLDIQSVNYVYFRCYFIVLKTYYAMLFYVIHSCIAFLRIVEV